MKSIDVTSLRAFAQTLEGKLLTTRARACVFQVQVTRDRLIFTPRSTGKPRPQFDRDTEAVLTRFRADGSLRPGDYHDLTVNASYLLAILEKYVNG